MGKGNKDKRFRGFVVSRTNLVNFPWLRDALTRELDPSGERMLSIDDILYVWEQGKFREAGEPEERPPLTAELLSLDPEDPRALATLVTDRALADLSGQLAENPELLNQEGMFEQWMNLALIEQGFATDPVMAATATKALGMGYLDMFASGELDDPDKAEEAARMFAQQLQALTGFEEAALEEEVSPEDELTALYEQQVKEQAEFEQMTFYRAGIMDLVSLAPAEARLGLMAGMLENPEIAKMFFPKAPEKPEWVGPLEQLGTPGPVRPPSSAGVIGHPELD